MSRKKAPKLESLFKSEIADAIELENKKNEKKVVIEKKKVSDEINTKIKKVSTTLYIPELVKDKLEEIQFSERKLGVNQNDLILEGIDLLFKKRGYPSIKKILS